MSGSAQPTSIRLSEATRLLLDKSARQLRRSRSYLVEEALKAQLPRIAEREMGIERLSILERLLALKGAGARAHGPTSVEKIEARQREFRGEE